MRLGLVLAEVGRQAEVKIADEEIDPRPDRARPRLSRPGEGSLGLSTATIPQALAELRAPIYEEKAVDHILGLAKVEDRKVTPEELMKPEDEDETPAEEAAPAG